MKQYHSKESKKELDRISFRGHQNILGLHQNTIEITKDKEITKRADCVIGVEASKGCSDLKPSLRQWIHSGRWLEFEIRCGSFSFLLAGRGSPSLELTDSREVVLRKSDYVSARTVSIKCSAAAFDMPRKMIQLLQNPDVHGSLIIKRLPGKTDEEFHWTLP